MGCSVSRLELRGRGTEAGVLSFKHKIIEDVSRSDRAILTNHDSGFAKLLAKKSLDRNTVALEKKDIGLGGAKELLMVPQQEHQISPAIDGYGSTQKLDSGKTEVGGLEVKHTENTSTREGKVNVEELEEGGTVIPNFDGPMWIASPSFREYCLPNGDSDDDSVKGLATIAKCNTDPDNISNLENLSKNIEITHDVPHDGSSGRSVKRRSNLRKVLTMHRPSAVRNFFNVTTCYNPLAPSAHNGPRKSHGK